MSSNYDAAEQTKLRIASAIASVFSDQMLSTGYTESGAQYVYDTLVDRLMGEDWDALHEIGRELALVRWGSRDLDERTS